MSQCMGSQALSQPISFAVFVDNLIDLMRNDVNNAFAARTCIVGVVVKNECSMASYFHEAGNLNGSNADK